MQLAQPAWMEKTTSEAGPERQAPNVWAGIHHARYLPDDVPFHIISRVVQGRWLLTPGPTLNGIIAGVVGRAQVVYPKVSLYAMAFLNNHVHMMAKGPAEQLSDFVGYIKREISHRWGNHPSVDWQGEMWNRYISTALPTEEGQLKCLKYILSQGVKEGIVSKSHHWPGIHSAKQLRNGSTLRGVWFDGTAHGRRKDVEDRKVHPKAVRRADYEHSYSVHLTPVPPWAGLSDGEQQARVRAMLTEIEAEGRDARGGKRTIGAKAAASVSREHRTQLPRPPWFTKRRRMICWARRDAPETRDFLDRHWGFQRDFRRGVEALKAGCTDATFPREAFIPRMRHAWRPASDTEPAAA